MNRKKIKTKYRSKPLQDLSHCLSSTDDSDTDDSEVVIPSSQVKKRIFQNPPRQKPRPSLIAKNLNEFVSSTPMHPTRKTFNRSLRLSPIENEPPEKQRRNSKSLQSEVVPSKLENSTTKRGKKNNSKLDNKSVLARPLQSDDNNEEERSQVNENRVITRSETRKTFCAHAQTSFTPVCKIIKSYNNVLTQTAADKGTQITDSLDGRTSKRNISRKRATIEKDDDAKEDEYDFTLTNENLGKNHHNSARDKAQEQCDEMSLTTVVVAGARKNISTGARADISTAAQTDIPASARTYISNASTTSRVNASIGARADASPGVRADVHPNIQEQAPNDSQSYAGSEGSWSKDGRKGRWLSDLLDGYFGESQSSTADCSPKEACAEMGQMFVRLERRNLIEQMGNGELSQSKQNSNKSVRTHDGNESNAKKNNSRKDAVKAPKNVPKKRRKEQETKENLANDADDEIINNNVAIDVSRHVLNSLREQMNNSNLAEGSPLSNKIGRVVQSPLENAADNTVVNKSVVSNAAQNDNHSYSGNASSYDSHANNADRTGKTNKNVTGNKSRQPADDHELSRMEVVENDILTPVKGDSTRNRNSEKPSARGKQNRKSKRNEEEIRDASRNLNEKDPQEADEPGEDESIQNTSNKRNLYARSCTKNNSAHSKLEAFLLSIAGISPPKVDKTLPRDKRKSKDERVIETNDAVKGPETSPETFRSPKINVLENHVLNAVDSGTTKKPTAKKTQRKNKEVIPAIIVAENTENESCEFGVRRSTRQRKQRTILYNPQIIYTNKREFLEFSKMNTALKSSTIAELSRIRLDDLKRQKRSDVTKEKSPKVKSKRPTKKQTRETIMETIDEGHNFDLVRHQTPISSRNPIESTTSAEVNTNTLVSTNGEKSTEDTTCVVGKNLSDPTRSNNDVVDFPQNNEGSKDDWYFRTAEFNDVDVKETLRTAIGSLSLENGSQSGWLEILPGRSKPKHTAPEFSLLFTVLEGTGLFQVRDSYQVLTRYKECYVPLGTYYSIQNQNKSQRLLLHYVKIKP